jgi:hypothetical protein
VTFSLITCNSQLHEMEADRLLFEDALASTSIQVKEEDVGISVDGMHHNAQELNGEAKKGISNPHDSLTDSEAVELQRGRTPLSHLQSETQIKVVEPSWSNFWQSPFVLYLSCSFCMFLITCND